MVATTTIDPFRSQSSSSSTPGLINSPASDWELQLAQYLQQVGNQQMQWAAQEYARAGQVTDAQINNYIQTAQQGSNLAGGMLDRYNNLYGPMTDQYAREAGTYASNGRLQHEMGRAESGVMQAGRKAEINAEHELQSFGIDPSSGRYQDLVRASKTADAAAAVGAGETARRQVEMEGTRRKETAINMGQQLPGAAVNAMNSTYQGIAGAENAALGLANTGVNLTTSPSKFFDPAMSLKYPPVGQTSTSQSMGPSTLGSSNQGQRAGGGGGGGGNRDPFNSDRFGRSSGGDSGLPPSRGGGNYGQNTPGYQAHPSTRQAGPSEPQGQIPMDQQPQYQGNDGTGWGDYDEPQQQPQYQGNDGTGWGDYDTYQQPQYQGNDGSGWGDFTAEPQPQYGGDSGAGWGDYDQAPQSYDDGSGWGDDSYARGGPVGGGVVPAGMSPSRGQQTDDVSATIPQTGGRAQINVGEFVMPKDVVQWKGQEFFQKMIAQARKNRVGAPAKPQRG
jgi:hypothetical protein